DIFGYINADDRYTHGALRYVTEYFDRHPQIDVLTGAIRLLDQRGRPYWRKRTSDPFVVADYVAGVCTVAQQATFFRRQAFIDVGGFNAENGVAWDGELLVDMAIAGMRFATVPKVLGDFRLCDGSITAATNYRKRLEDYNAELREKVKAHGVPLYPATE